MCSLPPVQRIKDRLADPKIIVWAHNSHVGDTMATSRGGAQFSDKNETWNLGQMARGTFGAGNVWIIGQYARECVVTGLLSIRARGLGSHGFPVHGLYSFVLVDRCSGTPTAGT